MDYLSILINESNYNLVMQKKDDHTIFFFLRERERTCVSQGEGQKGTENLKQITH